MYGIGDLQDVEVPKKLAVAGDDFAGDGGRGFEPQRDFRQERLAFESLRFGSGSRFLGPVKGWTISPGRVFTINAPAQYTPVSS